MLFKKNYIFFTILWITLCGTPAQAKLTADDVAAKVFHRNVGEDMQLQGTMELISKNGHIRTREFISLRKDGNKSRKVLIRFLSPADIKDTGFLVLENTANNKTQQHLYLPALQRTRRIVSSQMSRSFVNSDYSYEDMQRHPLSEWNYQLDKETTLNGQKCYLLISNAKTGTNTQYSKIISWVDKNTYIPLKSEMYDKNHKLLKTYNVVKTDVIQGIPTELIVVMENHSDQHKTRLTTLKIAYNNNLADRFFTTRALEK